MNHRAHNNEASLTTMHRARLSSALSIGNIDTLRTTDCADISDRDIQGDARCDCIGSTFFIFSFCFSLINVLNHEADGKTCE